MGLVQRIFNRKVADFYAKPDPGRHVHPRHKRDPRYAEEAATKRRERRRARRR
jgi:hypothetical protein